MNKISKRCRNCGAKNAGSILSKNYSDARLGKLVREGVLLGRAYGVAQIDGKLSPNLKEINDWLISEGIKPFGETAKQRHSLTIVVPDTERCG